MTEPIAPIPPPPQSQRTEGEALYRYAGVVTFFTLLSRILGMVRDLAISHRFGASGATDAWVQAFRIPNALRRLTAEGSMTTAFIPVYVDVRQKEGGDAAMRFAAQVLGLVLASTSLLALAGVFFSKELTLISSPGFSADPQKFDLTVTFTQWMFPYLVLVSVVAWAMGILNAEGRFAAPAASPIVFNIGIVAAVFWFTSYFAIPVLAIAAGILAGGVGQVLLQGPSLRAIKAPLVPSFNWSGPHMGRMFQMMGPSLFSMAVYQINIIVLGILASYLPTGQVFHFNNASRLTELVTGLFTFAFTTAGLPTQSAHFARGDWDAMRKTARFTFAAVLFTTLPATVGLFAAAEPIVAMLYRHGAFTMLDVQSTVLTLQFMALGMPAIAMNRVLTPIFYTVNLTRPMVVASAITVAIVLGVAYWLSSVLQVAGLALSLSFGAWFQAIAFVVVLHRKVERIATWFPWKSAGQQVAACVAMGALAYGISGFGDWAQGPKLISNWLVFLPLLIASAGTYALLTLVQREEQALQWVTLSGKVVRRLSRSFRRTGG